MRFITLLTLSVLMVASRADSAAASGEAKPSQKRKAEPKSQVQPLPPQPPMALRADTDSLDFHLSPLLKIGGLAAQIHQSLTDLIRETHGGTIIKLRAFVAGAGDARRVQAEAAQIFTDRRLPLPVLSVVQVGALGEEAAKVVIEAVVSTRRSLNPNGLAFFAGQSAPSLPEAVAALTASVAGASVAPASLLTATCFTGRMENFGALQSRLQASFPQARINLVQAVRDPANDESLCEGVGQLSQSPPLGSVVLLKNFRTTLVSTKQLVFTGLQLSFGSFLDDAHEAFSRLEHSAAALDATEAPVEVNVFSMDPSGGSALRKTTPVPPGTFTVQTVEGLPGVDAAAGIEAVMAPDVSAPAVQ